MAEQVYSVPGTIIWMAPFYNRTGFGVAARTIVSSLHRAGMPVRIIPVNQVEPGIDDCDLALIKSLESTPLISPITFIVSHVPGKSLLDIKLPEPNVRILATTVFDLSEDAGSPQEEALSICKEMDQIWLHVAGEEQRFIAAGFPPERVQYVTWPHHWLENPLLPPIRPETVGFGKPFRFLNISLFLPRRRWDTLIEAYLEEFRQTDNVELYLKVNYPFWHPMPGKPRQDLLALISSLRKKTRSEAKIIVDEDLGTRTGILNLIDSCNAYISTDTAATAPISEARVRQRMVIIPEDLNLGEIGIQISIDPGAGKIPLTREMLLYEPNHKGGFLPRLHVKDVRSAMRRAFEMSVEQRRGLAAGAAHILGPSDVLPHMVEAINRAWSIKMDSMRGPSALIEPAKPALAGYPAKNAKYKPGITAIVHTLNAEKHIDEALKSLQDWVDEIIVCDMKSDDRTAQIAIENFAKVIYHDRVSNLNVVRNFSASHAGHEWVFYLEADQRLLPKLGATLRRLVNNNPHFDALGIPVNEHWYGRKLHIYEAKWPFFKSPQLLRNGCFRFPDGAHLPVAINGSMVVLNANPSDTESAIAHFPWENMRQWMARMNEYSEEEALRLDSSGARYRWKDAASDFVNDFINWYHPKGHLDGALGFYVCFNFANHAFYKKAKLFERHLLRNDLQPFEEEGPQSFVEFFEYMLQAAKERERLLKGEQEKVPPAAVRPLEDKPEDLLPSVIWEGSQFIYHSLAGINRALCLGLLERGVNLSVIPYEPDEFTPEKGSKLAGILECVNASTNGNPVVHVRHKWPPNFERPPHQGHLVLMQPWEYGRIPAEWVQPLSTMVDEIWTPSLHSKKSFVSSGVPAERVHVVPNGVNTDLFNPQAASCKLPTSKNFKFLFVGGTIWRKGIDLLLAAYCDIFRRSHDVCLVIKDMGQDSFYRGQGFGEMIHRLQKEPMAPEIIYITQKMEERDIPGLITGCDCLVHPYRGEGFGLPVLEAMACGVPVITTEGGATDDFCPPRGVFLIGSKRVEFTPKNTRLAGGAGWVIEPDLNGLKNLMKEAFENRAMARQRALGLSEWVRREYSWPAVTEKVLDRIRQLCSKPVLRNSRR
ncbi:MAG: glycosyltransferase [Syntrophobacteraceae bacterium]